MIIPSPKKLLKFKQACSNIEEFGQDLKFNKIRSDTKPEVINNPEGIKKLLVCSGQVYYDLINYREKVKRNVIILI